ncbi:MAG: HEAT repeat domain-containing protein [Planctomycetota bacterium]
MKALCLFLATVLIALSCGVGCSEFVSEETPTDEESVPEHIVIDFEEQFDVAVREKGDKYVAARDKILEMGRDVIPLLEEKRSEDNEWEERFTAYVILAYFEHGKEYIEITNKIEDAIRHSLLRNPAASLPFCEVEDSKWIPLAVESLYKNNKPGHLEYFGENGLPRIARNNQDKINEYDEYRDEAFLKKPMEELALTKSSIPVNMAALDILYCFGGEGWVLPVVREGLKKLDDLEVDIRKSAAKWMRNLKWVNFKERQPSDEAVELLLETIRSDPDSDVRTYALRSLAAYKDPTVLPDLREILEDMEGTRWEQSIPFRVLEEVISDLESLADTEQDEETSSLTDIKESESPGHPWVMTSDGEKVLLFSTGYIRPSFGERETPRSEFYYGNDPKEARKFTLRKIREIKGLKGKDLKELRKFRGKRGAIVVKSEINASVEEWDKIPDELEWSGVIPTSDILVPHIPRISIAFSSDAIIYAGDVHGGGTRYVELAEVKKNGTYTKPLSLDYVKMDLPEEWSNVNREYYDLFEPNLFLFGGKSWICLTVEATRAPGRRAVCVAKTKDTEGDATITPWKKLKGYFVCPGAQPRIAITKEGIFCVAKMLEKGSNKEKIGTLSVYFSKDGKKWEHLKGKIPEIRCGDYDVTVSPDGAIYLFACAVRDKPDGEEDSEMQFEKTPKLYKTENIEEGWEEISLSQFEKVDVKSNLQACFHKGKLVIAAETTNSKIAFAMISPAGETPPKEESPVPPSRPGWLVSNGHWIVIGVIALTVIVAAVLLIRKKA